MLPQIWLLVRGYRAILIDNIGAAIRRNCVRCRQLFVVESFVPRTRQRFVKQNHVGPQVIIFKKCLLAQMRLAWVFRILG